MLWSLPKKIMLLLVAASVLSACSSGPTPPPPLDLNVIANVQANNGDLFYFVVRTTSNEKQFLTETYQDIANKAFADPPDPGSLGVFSIVPGTKHQYTVNQPAQGMIALYFLFTKPGSQWKKLLAMPFEEEYNINLKATSQVEISRHKPWYVWF